MLVTPETDRRNRTVAIVLALIIALASVLAALFWHPAWWLGLVAAGLAYVAMRRTVQRRKRAIAQPFPDEWEAALNQDVSFFAALDEDGKERFRNLVQVFLDEVAITGIRTEVDERTRVLVAASAVIPVFRFEDWEYSGLGEVLLYPDSFNEAYQSDTADDRHTLGMVGAGHLSGVMILSVPSLIAGFRNDTDKRNVGIHEFAHLVDKQDGAIDGIPARIPDETFDPWVRWIGNEMRSDQPPKRHIDDYAYTNEAEYFAVLSEYFFEAPEMLQKKDPRLYQMLENIYRQNTRRLFRAAPPRKGRVGRNQPCPCGSTRKYKKCCRLKMMRGRPKTKAAARR